MNGKPEKFYYSVLVKGGEKLDEVWTNQYCMVVPFSLGTRVLCLFTTFVC